MPKNKHTAALPDGTIATRNTDNRIYPFCVAERPSYECALFNARTQNERKFVRAEYDWCVRETGPNAKYPDSHGEHRLATMRKTAAMSFEDYAATVVADALDRVKRLKEIGH